MSLPLHICIQYTNIHMYISYSITWIHKPSSCSLGVNLGRNASLTLLKLPQKPWPSRLVHPSDSIRSSQISPQRNVRESTRTSRYGCLDAYAYQFDTNRHGHRHSITTYPCHKSVMNSVKYHRVTVYRFRTHHTMICKSGIRS